MNFFAYPHLWPWLLVPVGAAALYYLGRRRRDRALAALGQRRTVVRMLPRALAVRRRIVAALRVAGFAALGLALMGPLLGAKLVEFKQRGLDVFIAIDCSLSMQAEDLKPNRMAHAKLILGQLIDRLATSRIGVIAFAGQAYVQCPLTIDTLAARDALEAVGIGSVPIPGTAVGEAIRTALKGLKVGESGNRVLVLLTDGEDHESDPVAAAKEAAKSGLKIFAIGIGSPDGVPIPLFDQHGRRVGYKTDRKGEVVLSKLDESMLIRIAQDTDGAYFRASVTGDEIEQLAAALERLEQGDQKTRMFNRFENRYQWPLAAGLLLLLISLAIPERPAGHRLFAKSEGRASLLLLLLLLASGAAQAAPAELKKANRHFWKGNYERALKLYDDALVDAPHSSVLHFNAGAAAYQSGDFRRAEREFSEAAALAKDPQLQASAHYNRGNALIRQQSWDDAIEAYKQSLRLNPSDEDAKYNLGVARRLKANPPPPQGGGKDPKPSSGGQEQKKEQQTGPGESERPTPKPGQMSKEDAERLLSAAAANELKKSGPKIPKAESARPDEDW